MTGRQQQEDRARWQQVLRLGEALLSPHSTTPPGNGAGPPAGLPAAEGAHSILRSNYTALLAHRDQILETASRLMEAEARLWLAEGLLPFPATRLALQGLPQDEDLFTPEPPTDLMRCSLHRQQLCCRSLSGTETALEEENCAAAAGAAAVAVPFLTRRTETGPPVVLGVLEVERPEHQPFTLTDIELLEALSVQVVIALQADRQMAIERWRVQQLSLVRRVSAQIADVRDLDELSRRVAQLILETFNYYYVAIFTLEPGEEILHFRASAGPVQPNLGRSENNPEEGYSPVLSVHMGEGIIGFVAQTGEEVLAGDVSQNQHFRYLDSLPETRSEIVLPLKIEDRVLGALDVQSDQLNDFDETDLLVLRSMAHNIAIAVEGARLYGALRHRADQLLAVSEVSNAITSILDQEQLLDEVVTLIRNRFGYPFVHLYTVHPGRRKIFYEAGSGSRSEMFRELGYAYDLDDPQGIIPWVARNGETVLANDVETEPRYRPSPLPPDNTRSELTVPLIFGGNVLGVLDVQSDLLNAFGEDDRFLFEALADNVAIAMRNATLYRSELWRREVADSLREVAGLLSADVDLDQVLDEILTELERTLPSDVTAIWLVDEGEAESETGHPRIHLAALHATEAAGLDLEVGMFLDEIVGDHLETGDQSPSGNQALTEGGPGAGLPADWLMEALEADHPVIRSSQAPFEPIGTALGFLADYSAIAAPLRVGEQSLGVLSLAHHTPGRYGSEARAMTAAFASYAAVAIENTRLYEAAHEQAWVSTVLLQVGDATQTLTNLNELLSTVVRITPMLVGVKACALYLLDEEDCFVPAAASGLSHDQQAEFERWRFAPGDVEAFDQLRSNKQPVILQGDAEDPRVAGILFAGLEAELLFESELLALVPMLAHGEVLGAFLIDYSNDLPGRSRLDARETHFDEELAIIQGIAHQTAIAVENIRLLKSQKEEAYVSVALLQVAQAVVSSNDLDEILGSIVRITPILVGVKRSVIYLWDAGRARFRLAQSYGIPRGAEAGPYSPGEFPLLDAVRELDTLLAIPLEAEADLPAGPPEVWAQLEPPGQDRVNEYLDSPGNLLLAFPLSVKGEVLGVLLVEEPELAGLEPFSGDGVARRLREKRLEITTGISQQAALAIQNDRLQREMVERGRLEREMQLAREIQRTFLPRLLPRLPGWDLCAMWRTAREVGGDFYDVFELPEGRLGLVIADVADKGMPAALFMTLIRTLVRAAVQQAASPAEVLARVNDILVPDAQQGMFVTVVYGVLEVETGDFTYANAGHNPPLLLRHQSQEIQRLEKGGMALGVLDGNRVQEKTVSIQTGDYLILYTDGFTEAFDPAGEMFGEVGLQRTVREAQAELDGRYPLDQNDVAEEMLEAIDDAVSEFIEDSIPSDDLTLVVLRRMAVE